MEAEEHGKGTEHQRQNIDRLRREAKELARQNLMTSPSAPPALGFLRAKVKQPDHEGDQQTA
jgi:hypothetical protein